MDVLYDRSRSLLIIYSPSCPHGLCYISYCFINIFNHSCIDFSVIIFDVFVLFRVLVEDYGHFEMVDIKTMVLRHCGIELPSVLAANKKRSKLISTLLCWGHVTLKFVHISIKLKKKWQYKQVSTKNPTNKKWDPLVPLFNGNC